MIPRYDTPDESELNAMDQSQWQILQQMLQQRDAARQGGAGIPGMAGTPGGPVQESPTRMKMQGR